jgi:hypothetical protein
LSDVERITTVFVVTGRTPSEMEQAVPAVKMQIAFYASTPSYRGVLELHGWEFGEQLSALSKRGQWDVMSDVITDDVLEQVAVIAPLDRLGAAIKARYGDRVQRVGYYLLGPEAGWSDEEFAALVASTR